MKKHLMLLSFVLVALSAAHAYATCPTAPTYYFIGGSGQWYDYSPDTSCVVAYGSPTPSSGSLWCYNEPAWTTGTGWANVSYTFQPLQNQVFNTWEASALVEFSDPNNSTGNYVQLWATVTHNGSTSYHLLDSHNGSQGAMSCDQLTGTFSAAVGDDVTIDVYSYKANSNATIQAGIPRIYTY